jgi:hypothetical protein
MSGRSSTVALYVVSWVVVVVVRAAEKIDAPRPWLDLGLR